MHPYLAVFLTVFLAELGDKTQLATLLFAADPRSHAGLVFLAASTALVASTAIAVICGAAAERLLPALPLKPIAGIGFLVIGLWMLYEHLAKG